ncbi:hypothetical protein P3W45_000780 [Vairimorpha bombi]|jgi:hypothetical protein
MNSKEYEHKTDYEYDHQKSYENTVNTTDPFMIKHRKRTSKKQLEVLEKTFETCIRPDSKCRKKLGDQLNMTPRAVQIWFQNRRAKIKKLNGEYKITKKKIAKKSKSMEYDSYGYKENGMYNDGIYKENGVYSDGLYKESGVYNDGLNGVYNDGLNGVYNDGLNGVYNDGLNGVYNDGLNGVYNDAAYKENGVYNDAVYGDPQYSQYTDMQYQDGTPYQNQYTNIQYDSTNEARYNTEMYGSSVPSYYDYNNENMKHQNYETMYPQYTNHHDDYYHKMYLRNNTDSRIGYPPQKYDSYYYYDENNTNGESEYVDRREE